MKKTTLALLLILVLSISTACSSDKATTSSSTFSKSEEDILSTISENEALLSTYEKELKALKLSEPSEMTDCPSCGGKTMVVCSVCNGDYDSDRYGYMNSGMSYEEQVQYILNGDGKCDNCSYGYVKCSVCSGTGGVTNTSYSSENTQYLKQLSELTDKISELEAENDKLIASNKISTSSGSTYVPVTIDSSLFETTETTCELCSGTGKRSCTFCSGTGKYNNTWSDIYNNTSGSTQSCSGCSGKGYLSCYLCGGDGKK